jgi:hypothetical protein
MAVYLSVPKAIEQVTGARPHPSTCWRWAIRGVGGTQLQTWLVGGRRKTTVGAVETFIEARTEASVPKSIVASGRRRESDRVQAELDRELGG